MDENFIHILFFTFAHVCGFYLGVCMGGGGCRESKEARKMPRACRSPAPCPPSIGPATNGAAGRASAIKESRKNTEEQ